MFSLYPAKPPLEFFVVALIWNSVISLIMVWTGIRARGWGYYRMFSEREKKGGFWYMFSVTYVTAPLLFFLAVNWGAGGLTWLGGVMRHDHAAKSFGWRCFGMGLLALALYVFVRHFLFPRIFLRKLPDEKSP
ncbi:MAG: hypothetical protein QM715_10680 [Nibricoccus sp.]